MKTETTLIDIELGAFFGEKSVIMSEKPMLMGSI